MSERVLPAGSSSPAPTRAVLSVRECGPGEGPRWDAYVAAHPRATFFHQHGWQEVLRELGYRPLRLVAEREGAVRGVLPLALARDLRGTRRAISLPHTMYGGPLADDDACEQALFATAERLAAGGGARRIELRNRHPGALELPRLEGYVTFERELPVCAASLVRGFSKGARSAVSQARRRGVTVAPSEDLALFHRLLAASYRRLGTPVYPRRFLAAIRDRFPDQVSILIASHRDRPVAGVFSLRFRDGVMPLFSGGLPEARALRAHHLQYLRLMELALADGVRRFDFGRSRLSHPGVVAFKRHLGFAPIPLPYQAWPAAGDPGPDPNRGPWLLARWLWRRLPAVVADRLGPLLVSRFP